MLDATLLRRLLTEASTEIAADAHTPAGWYAGRVLPGPGGGQLGGSDYGPYPTAEDALIALLRAVWRRLDEAEAEARQLAAELAALRTGQ